MKTLHECNVCTSFPFKKIVPSIKLGLQILGSSELSSLLEALERMWVPWQGTTFSARSADQRKSTVRRISPEQLRVNVFARVSSGGNVAPAVYLFSDTVRRNQ